MNPRLNKSVTLLELLIAITLLSVIVIGFTSIDIFSRYHVLTSDRRAKLQNEVSYVLEHMSKEIGKAVGNVNQPAVDTSDIANAPAIRVWIDDNNNGQQDSGDRQIAYRYQNQSDAPYHAPAIRVLDDNNNVQQDSGDRQIAYRYQNQSDASYQILYYSNYSNYPNSSEVIAQKISSCNFQHTWTSIQKNNYVDVTITACWDPDGTPHACGTPDNPSVTMQTRIKMPSVSTN